MKANIYDMLDDLSNSSFQRTRKSYVKELQNTSTFFRRFFIYHPLRQMIPFLLENTRQKYYWISHLADFSNFRFDY